MKAGIFYLSHDINFMFCRVIVGEPSGILNLDVQSFLQGVTPSGVADSIISGYAETLVNEVTSGLSGEFSANILSAIEPYINGIDEGISIPEWSQIIAGSLSYVNTPYDCRFYSASAKALRFPILETSGIDLKLLEVTTIDISFQKRTEAIKPFKVPNGYVQAQEEGLIICAPNGQYDWARNYDTVWVSQYYETSPTNQYAALDLRFSPPFVAPTLPLWHFIYQTGKEYHATYQFDEKFGLYIILSNIFNYNETPMSAVPFFSADYPTTPLPYGWTREFNPASSYIFMKFGNDIGGNMPALYTQTSGITTTVIPEERIEEERKRRVGSTVHATALLILRHIKERN